MTALMVVYSAIVLGAILAFLCRCKHEQRD